MCNTVLHICTVCVTACTCVINKEGHSSDMIVGIEVKPESIIKAF